MRAEPLTQGRGLLAAVAALAESWLLHPPEVRSGEVPPAEPEERGPRSVIAVVGLAPRCGASTVARGLGALLGAADPARAAVVTSPRLPPAAMLRTPAAARLARELSEVGLESSRPAGRLCLLPADDAHPAAAMARALAPVVLDVPRGVPVSEVAELADLVVLVSSPDVAPSLAHVAADATRRRGPAPLVAINRVRPPAVRDPGVAAALPDARLGAQLALAGREPPGAFGDGLAELARACTAVRAR